MDLQHSFDVLDGATVVENWIAKADFEIDGETIRKGTWLMTVEVTDESVWEAIEKGDITGFSMGGVGNYSEEDVELDEVTKQAAGSSKKGLLKQLAAALGVNVVEKGAMAELYEERSKGSLFWNAFNSLEEILYKYDPITGRWQYEANEDKVRECLEDFVSIITSILTGKESITKAIEADRPEGIEKAGKKMSTKNKDTLSGIYESLGTFLKEFDDPEENPDDEKNKSKEDETGAEDDKTKKKDEEEKEVTKQEVEAIVTKSLEAAIAKAMGAGEADDKGEAAAQAQAAGVEKSEELTTESIDAMVQAAVEKALKPQEEPHVTTEQVQNMITKAVENATASVLKSRGLPSNFNGDGSVQKSAGEEHYLHGIL
ncbi:hypothetical protein 2016_scaffold57_00083 [Bacteriophage sp.]|nr:hypothetical protein 2016_scaffold57_00083 [Bacteriophage sp.]